MKPSRSCDKCYRIKARCNYEDGTSTCERCARLGHACKIDRAVLPPGRPRSALKPRRTPSPREDTPELTPRHDNSEPTTSHTSPARLRHEGRLLPIWKGFGQDEITLIEFVLHPDQIGSLIFGQTFQRSMRSEMASQLYLATDQLKDGLLAFANALLVNKYATVAQQLNIPYVEKGSRALQRLGSMGAASVDEARTTLGLALMLVTYNDLSMGAPTLPISRSALLQVMPWRNHLIRPTTEDTDPNIICLLFVEISECLVLGQRPVFRFEAPQENSILDRYYGVCHELLPLLYDICLLYNSIRSGSISLIDTALEVECITSLVDQWSPELALELRSDVVVDRRERCHFLLQAKAFKSALQLLLLQTQRTTTGDLLARTRAVQLHSEVLDVMRHGVDRPKYVLFPYFVACLECSTADEDMATTVLDTMNKISNGLAPKSCQSMLACLRHIWGNRRRRPDLPWFECIEQGLSVAMGP